MIVVLVAALAAAIGGAVGTAQAEGSRSSSDRQLLFYNHSYGVLDRETADAIEHSDYLKDFANFLVRTTTGTGGQTWTGRYLMGRETYLELFGVGDISGPDGTLGSAGLGLSTERDGDLATVTERLRNEGVTPIDFLQTRDFGDGVPVPWFDAVLTATEYDASTRGRWSTGRSTSPIPAARPSRRVSPVTSAGNACCPTTTAPT
ncbi:hypothetical protein M2156_003125 [Streptomyces sp. SAI-149]|nr:hypothetical protein [Streptomyces sp. SAI-119]MDH6496906.1 hypothetical protein [Streptomyces sp. SAI-149]